MTTTGAERDLPAGVKRALGIQGWMNLPELLLLHRLAGDVPTGGSVVEVGTWKGRSAVAMCDALTSVDRAQFFAVDTFLGTDSSERMLSRHAAEIADDHIYKEFVTNARPYSFVHVVRMPSLQASREFESESIDLLFVDADHTFDQVLLDIRHWFAKVKVGGIIAGHDYPKFDVKRAVHTHFATVETIGSVWYVQRPSGKLPFRPWSYASGRVKTLLYRFPRVEEGVRRAWVSARSTLDRLSRSRAKS